MLLYFDAAFVSFSCLLSSSAFPTMRNVTCGNFPASSLNSSGRFLPSSRPTKQTVGVGAFSGTFSGTSSILGGKTGGCFNPYILSIFAFIQCAAHATASAFRMVYLIIGPSSNIKSGIFLNFLFQVASLNSSRDLEKEIEKYSALDI